MAHILVIEADEREAEHAAQILIDAGHACGWIGDAASALQIIRRRRPDLVLLNDHLPGESGTDLLRRLRNSPQFYDLPVIMLAKSPGFKEEQIAYYHGAHDYIRKPFSDLMLQHRVNALLRARGAPALRALADRLGKGNGSLVVRRVL